MLAFTDLFAHRLIVYSEIHFVSMILWCRWINIRTRAIMNKRNYTLGRSFQCKLFGSYNLTSNDVVIEATTSKTIKIIWFTNTSFKFYSWNGILQNVYKGPFAMLWTKFVNIPKESRERDWDNKYCLNKRPPKTTSVAWNCNPWEKAYPLIDLLEKIWLRKQQSTWMCVLRRRLEVAVGKIWRPELKI